MPFIQVIDSAKPVSNVIPFKPKEAPTLAIQDNVVDFATKRAEILKRLEPAKNFILDFRTSGKRFAYDKSLDISSSADWTKSDIKKFDFYVEDLVDYYKKADEARKDQMKALLDIFEVKLCGTGDNDDYQSVQYLANSGKQERILAGYDGYLERNTDATHTENVTDKEEKYHYLVSKHGGKVTNIPDFIYTDNNDIKVDAKIYGDVSSMDANYSKKTHDADFLIVYLKYSISESSDYYNKQCNEAKNSQDYFKACRQQQGFTAAASKYSKQLGYSTRWLLVDLLKNKPGCNEAKLKLEDLVKTLNVKHPQIKLDEKTDFS
jgi:hypothetical protein